MTEERYLNGQFKGFMGPENHNWKGGRRLVDGYWYILVSNHPYTTKQGYVCEHRLVMEKKIGRYLTREEEVHHINGIKTDNRIENLMLFSNAAKHRHYEKTLDKSNRYCLLCGQKTYTDKKGHERWYFYRDGFICQKCYKIEKRRNK